MEIRKGVHEGYMRDQNPTSMKGRGDKEGVHEGYMRDRNPVSMKGT